MANSVHVAGADEVIAKLASVAAAVAKQHIRTALREGAYVVRDEVFAIAPVRTSVTREALKVRASKFNRNGDVAFVVSLGEGYYKGDTYYGAFVDLGHKQGSRKLGNARKQIPGVHFMKRGLDQSSERAANVAVNRLVDLLNT